MGSLNSLAGSIAFGTFSIILGAVADLFDARIAMIVAHVALLAPLLLYRKIFIHDQTVSHSASSRRQLDV